MELERPVGPPTDEIPLLACEEIDQVITPPSGSWALRVNPGHGVGTLSSLILLEIEDPPPAK